MFRRFAWMAFAFAASAFAQQQAGQRPARVVRPPLFLKEDWKQLPSGGEHPVTLAATGTPELELKLYGPASKDIQLTGKEGDENDPIHLWTGLCTANCAATLRDKNNFADLTGLARIRWVTKVSGFHKVRPLLKLADGTFLVGDHADGSMVDWQENEFLLADVNWLKLDPEKVVTRGTWVEKPDLSKVDEVGFVDLMQGSGHGQGGWSDIARIEVYGKAVKRDSAGQSQ